MTETTQPPTHENPVTESVAPAPAAEGLGIATAAQPKTTRLPHWRRLLFGPNPGAWAIARSSLLAILGSIALVVFLSVLQRFYPVTDWIFWKYAKAAVPASLMIGGCLLTGLAVVERVWAGIRFRERWVFGAACGVYVYYVVQFCAGLLGFFGALWALLLPGVMAIAGAWGSRRTLGGCWRHRHQLKLRFGARTGPQALATALGICLLGALYVSILHPRNAAFDALWYHLGLGEGWAVEGGIRRSPEGWYMSTLPNMAAVIYSWAFLVPGLDLFEIMMIAAHQEYLLFLVTLSFIPIAVKMLVPDARPGISWLVVFLFPSMMIYDAGLHSGNDHVAAFWGVPVFLALRRMWRHPDVKGAALLALCASGAILTKYQAASLVFGPALLMLGRGAWLTLRSRSKEPILALGAALGCSLLFTTPLWLKNWVWYGDPLYPALHGHLKLRPWSKDAAAYMDMMWDVNVWRPRGTQVEQLLETLRKGFSFSFESHAHWIFHRDWPYFGSLFTLCLLWLPLLRGQRRVWGLALCAQLGVFTWYYLSHVERYLQALIPWMSVVVAAIVILTWRHGWLARLPLALLVWTQLVWGGDALTLRGHAMLHESPLVSGVRMVETGFKGTTDARDRPAGTEFPRLADLAPDGSVLLLHDHNGRVGLRHRVVVDKPRYQALIRYGEMDSVQDVQDIVKQLGISHVIWRATSTGYPTLGADLRFQQYAQNLGKKRRKVGGFYISEVPDQLAPHADNDTVLYAGCRNTFQKGLHHLEAMNELDHRDGTVKNKPAFEPLPGETKARAALLDRVAFVVYSKRCSSGVPYPPRGFRKAQVRKEEELWVRPWK